MNLHIISADCVAFMTGREEIPGKEEAARLVRSLLSERGLPQWDVIEIDMFTAEDEALVLARPSGVWIPGYALEFLRERL